MDNCDIASNLLTRRVHRVHRVPTGTPCAPGTDGCTRYRRVPTGAPGTDGYRRVHRVPTGAPGTDGCTGYRRVPTGTDGYRQVPTGTDGYRRVPTDADGCRRVPTGADRCRRVPTGDGCRRVNLYEVLVSALASLYHKSEQLHALRWGAWNCSGRHFDNMFRTQSAVGTRYYS